MFVRLGIYELLFMWVILTFPIFEIMFKKMLNLYVLIYLKTINSFHGNITFYEKTIFQDKIREKGGAVFYSKNIFKMLGLRADSSILVSASAVFVCMCDTAHHLGR